MKSTLETSIIGFSLCFASILLVGFLQYRAERRAFEDNQRVSHSQEVFRDLTATRNDLNGADASAQSFFVTGEASYLTRFDQLTADMRKQVQSLRNLVADSPVQQHRLDDLEPLINNSIQSLQDEIDIRRTEKLSAGSSLGAEHFIRKASNDVRAVIADMEAEEDALLRQQASAAVAANHQTNVLIGLGCSLAIVFLGIFAYALSMDIRERIRSEEGLRDLSGHLLQVQDNERRRIARELHDSAGQTLAALGMTLGTLDSEDGQMSPEAKKTIGDSLSMIGELTKEIRTISYLLHPPLLDEIGVVLALRGFVEGFSERSSVKVAFECPDDLGRFSQDLEIAIFRIVQECLTNIHRHSGSPVATIRITRADNQVRVEVEDKGKGITPERRSAMHSAGTAGVGVRGMRERVRQLGGSLEINSDGPGKGTLIVATLPVSVEHVASTEH